MPPPVQTTAPKLLPHEIFSEAISVIPWLHLPREGTKRVLTIGYDAAPAGEYALRHRETTEAIFVGAAAPKDARAKTAATAEDFQLGWKADLVCVAKPGLNPSLFSTLKMLVPTGLVCVALERFDMITQAKAMIRPLFREMVIYRENLPEPSLFILASNTRIQRIRPVSATSRRYTDRYVATLFTFAKDELQTILGQNGTLQPSPVLAPTPATGPGLPGIVDAQGPANSASLGAGFWPGRR